MHERSREGEESWYVDGCWGSLGGFTGGGGGADGVSNIMAEYFVDLKRIRLQLTCNFIRTNSLLSFYQKKIKVVKTDYVNLKIAQQMLVMLAGSR